MGGGCLVGGGWGVASGWGWLVGKRHMIDFELDFCCCWFRGHPHHCLVAYLEQTYAAMSRSLKWNTITAHQDD